MSLKQKRKLAAVNEVKLLKLDLGCGPRKKEGFLGVDNRQFPGVDQVVDLTRSWPWVDGSVEEIYSSHFIEHLNAEQRIHFVNEAFRVLVPGGKMMTITPHWCSTRAYGDLTHQWPPVCEMWFYYLNAEWRAQNAPHNDGYECDFEVTWGYSLSEELVKRNDEYRAFALANYKEAALDMIATWTKKTASVKVH